MPELLAVLCWTALILWLLSVCGYIEFRRPARDLFTCTGKGGTYERIGAATGAGKCRLVGPLVVYRDLATRTLYFRTIDDFAERMAPVDVEEIA